MSPFLVVYVYFLSLVQSVPLIGDPSALSIDNNALDEVFSTPRGALSDVFIAVKTSAKFHGSRLPPILDTWFKEAAGRVYFFTDAADAALELRAGGRDHVINTGCAADHSRDALSCKMEAELETFLDSAPSAAWFCHVDDDNYVNTAELAAALARYPADKDWYLGKVSIPHPLEILDRAALPRRRKIRFWFATGGAGFCLSRPLAERMRPWVGGGRFRRLADDIRLPDDVTVGYLAEVLLEAPLQQLPGLHSHLEPLRLVTRPQGEITLSYGRDETTGEENVVELGTEDLLGGSVLGGSDPTKFYAIYCRIHPEDCVN